MTDLNPERLEAAAAWVARHSKHASSESCLVCEETARAVLNTYLADSLVVVRDNKGEWPNGALNLIAHHFERGVNGRWPDLFVARSHKYLVAESILDALVGSSEQEEN